MANPQLKNGYIKLANGLFEALCHIRINGEARQVLDTIIRKTYGFNKKQDKISLSQFSLSTGLKRPIICRALTKLKKMNLIIIIQKDNDKEDNDIQIYQFNKDFDQWKALSKKITTYMPLSKKIIPIIQKDNASLSKKIHTKDNTTKDNTTKDNGVATSPKSPHQEIIDFYYEAYKQQEGVNYVVSGGDGKAVKEALTTKQMSPQEVKSVLRWYLERPDFKKFPTIKAALSGHFINLYRQGEEENE